MFVFWILLGRGLSMRNPLEFMEIPRVHGKIFSKNVRKQTPAATPVPNLFQVQVPTIQYPFFSIPKNTSKTHKTSKPRFPNYRDPGPVTSSMFASAFPKPLSHHQKRLAQTNAKVQATKVAAIKGTEERICLKWLGRKGCVGPLLQQ